VELILSTLVITCVVLLPIVGLAFYAMHRSRPTRLKLSASLLKLFSFSIEVESDDHREEPRPVRGDGEPRKLPGTGPAQ
jgi:hypothetical protein